jgi:D-3-phosphoglycerate dehydrogenase
MGVELRGKTLGIVGIGRIGQATAKMALGFRYESHCCG